MLQIRMWICDITYLDTAEVWLYLAVVIDLFSLMLVGWSMDKRMKVKLVCEHFADGLVAPADTQGRRDSSHSDRGSQYCFGRYQAIFSKKIWLRLQHERQGQLLRQRLRPELFPHAQGEDGPRRRA